MMSYVLVKPISFDDFVFCIETYLNQIDTLPINLVE